MSHTNETPNFDLPQFTADDKPDWLVDVNAAFLAIDTGMEATQSTAESASSTAQLAQETATGAADTAGQASRDVAGLTTSLETLQGTVNTVTSLIGNGTPTTTDKTIIGAINEINEQVERGSVSVTADGVKTFSQIYNELFAAADISKVTVNAKLVEKGTGYAVAFNFVAKDATTIQFSKCDLIVSPGATRINMAALKATGSTLHEGTVTTAPVASVTDNSAAVPTSGIIYELQY